MTASPSQSPLGFVMQFWGLVYRSGERFHPRLSDVLLLWACSEHGVSLMELTQEQKDATGRRRGMPGMLERNQ